MPLLSFFRTPVLSSIKTQLLLEQLKGICPEVNQLTTEFRFYIEVSKPLTPEEEKILIWLLSETFQPHDFSGNSLLGKGNVFEVGPRRGTVSPWSSNALAICHNCGLKKIIRIERARRYQLYFQTPVLIAASQKQRIYELFYDQMTEEPYFQPLESLLVTAEPEPVQTIPLSQKGFQALADFAEEKGLALTPEMRPYIFDYFFGKLQRDPTDAEIFKFGQLNSQHCRHLLFNGLYVIDGVKMPSTLMEMIKSTIEVNWGNVIVAFSDNSCGLRPMPVNIFKPLNPLGPSVYVIYLGALAFILKVETHNHPTGVSPYDGAATGLAVRRDGFGFGQGGVPVAHLACYNVGNLFIAGYILPWEWVYAPYPKGIATPLEIIIEASNGASDNANAFGNPVIFGSFTAFEEIVSGDHYGWKKPAMVAGSFGYADERHLKKERPQQGMLVVQIGGPAYRIGLGGGSASSKELGSQAGELDFDSVQRDDPEMEKRNFDVIRACSQLGEENPIAAITDLGAGGDSVAIPELVYPAGAKIELREIPCGDTSMPVYVFLCNESQERMLVLVWTNKLEVFQRLCQRFRCPMAVIGKITGDGQLIITDRNTTKDAPWEQREPVNVSMNFLLSDLPQIRIECQRVTRSLQPLALPANLTINEALGRVLRLPKVASKQFLTRKADRSVGGLVAQQQTVGPLQLPLADCAVLADSFFQTTGQAMALGEQPIKGLVDTADGARMSLGESLTNLIWALVSRFEDINFSATWQWPCGQPGEDARLYKAVKAATDLCKQLGLRIPVGKDSVSMTAWTEKDGQKHPIKAPGTVQLVNFAPCPDIEKTVTPDIKQPGQSKLIFIDLSGGRRRLGGSALAQVYNQVGDQTPDVDNPSLLHNSFEAIQHLICRGLILSGHDRSDGGLITCLLEMAFAGNCGLDINLRNLTTDPIAFLFNEELGLVIEYLLEDEKKIRAILQRHGLAYQSHIIAQTVVTKEIRIFRYSEEIYSENMRFLRDIWQETSFELDKLQANPELVREERQNIYDREGPYYHLTFQPQATPSYLLNSSNKPKVAILKEEGTNGDQEMAGAFWWAGFEPWEVTITDLIDGRVGLDQFRGLAGPGGFTYKDVLDAGKGLAGVIRFNPRLQEMFNRFYQRSDTFSLWVCNGCQVSALLGWVPWSDIPIEKQPRFIRNQSEIFESRFVNVRISKSHSIFFQGMAGSILGVWVAHGEGRLYFPDEEIFDQVSENRMIPLTYVNDRGQITENYPFNPNGSPFGAAGLCSLNGRHLAIMPHPERLFLKWQWPYWPSHWQNLEVSPWLRMFQNARIWCEKWRLK